MMPESEEEKRVRHELTIEAMWDISAIRPNLYLTGESGAKNLTALENLKVTHVFSVGHEYNGAKWAERYKYTRHFTQYTISDNDDQDIIPVAESIYKMYKTMRSDEVALVHCGGGISRSVAVVIFILLQECGGTYEDALKHVRSKRWIAGPNGGFKRQLIEYFRLYRD